MVTMTEKRQGSHGLATAVFDQTGCYRYRLTRNWDDSKPTLAWCLLNPSTADASTTDPTLRRVMDFSSRWGFGSVDVVNLFAWRSPVPSQLSLVPDPVGAGNDEHVGRAARDADAIVVAWGNHGVLPNPVSGSKRCDEVRALLEARRQPLLALGATSKGQPRHPLYVPADRRPTRLY